MNDIQIFYQRFAESTGPEQEDGGAVPSMTASDRKKPVYFEWAKKTWEAEETFKLPDGTYWPYVSMLTSQLSDLLMHGNH